MDGLKLIFDFTSFSIIVFTISFCALKEDSNENFSILFRSEDFSTAIRAALSLSDFVKSLYMDIFM